jgi:hypothetical protein
MSIPCKVIKTDQASSTMPQLGNHLKVTGTQRGLQVFRTSGLVVPVLSPDVGDNA